jgi:hypothetical protein
MGAHDSDKRGTMGAWHRHGGDRSAQSDYVIGLFAQAVYQRTLLHSLPKVVESYRAMSLMTLSFTVLDNRAVTRRCLNPRVVRCRWRPAPSEPRPARELVGAFLAAAKSLDEPYLPPLTPSKLLVMAITGIM